MLARAAAAAPYGYLLKPFQLRELNATVQMAMVRREEERKTERAQRRLQLAVELGGLAASVELAQLLVGLDDAGRTAFHRLMESGEPIALTCRCQDSISDPDTLRPEPRWVELHARHFAAERLIMGMMRDVSGKVESEMHLRQALVVYDATSEAILFLDAERRVLSSDAALCRNTGWADDELRGRRPEEFLYARRHGDRQPAEAGTESGRHDGQQHNEVTCLRADGCMFPLCSTCARCVTKAAP